MFKLTESRTSRKPIVRKPFNRTGFLFDVYHTLDEINQFLTLTVANSDGATVHSIGKSFEDREIYRVDIGNTNMPKIIIDCGIHAREWASPAFCLYVIDQLMSGGYTGGLEISCL